LPLPLYPPSLPAAPALSRLYFTYFRAIPVISRFGKIRPYGNLYTHDTIKHPSKMDMCRYNYATTGPLATKLWINMPCTIAPTTPVRGLVYLSIFTKLTAALHFSREMCRSAAIFFGSKIWKCDDPWKYARERDLSDKKNSAAIGPVVQKLLAI
jgi:hypothetical protein